MKDKSFGTGSSSFLPTPVILSETAPTAIITNRPAVQSKNPYPHYRPSPFPANHESDPSLPSG